MGKKQSSVYQLSPWTAGAGHAIGTNVDIGGVLMGPGATTVILKLGTSQIMQLSGGSVVFEIATTGPLNATGSGNSFAVMYKERG